MYFVSYYSKPRAQIGMSEEDVQKNYNTHHNKIVTKKIEENVTATACKYCKPGHVDKWIKQINRIINPILVDVIGPFWSITMLRTDTALNDYYHTFTIPKHNGQRRTIEAPNEDLKQAQRKLLKVFAQDMKVLPHNAAHGFTKGRGCKSALEVHQRNKSNWFIKMDIKDFFPSCNYELILSSLRQTYPFCLLSIAVLNKIVWMCTKEGRLVQGAPTSPFLANICMLHSDYKIYNWCKEQGMIYTRYADDILISCVEQLEKSVVERVIRTHLPADMELNISKTRIGSCSGRNWNLGLMYNEAHDITVGYRKKKEVKHAVHNFETKEEMQNWDEKSRLLGLIGYCKYIEPEYFQPYLDRVQAVEL